MRIGWCMNGALQLRIILVMDSGEHARFAWPHISARGPVDAFVCRVTNTRAKRVTNSESLNTPVGEEVEDMRSSRRVGSTWRELDLVTSARSGESGCPEQAAS